MQVEKENQLEQDVFQKGQNEPSLLYREVIWRVYPACEVDQSFALLSLSRTFLYDRQTDRQTERQTQGRQTDRQINGQTDRQNTAKRARRRENLGFLFYLLRHLFFMSALSWFNYSQRIFYNST